MADTTYANELLTTVERIRRDLHGAEDLARLIIANQESLAKANQERLKTPEHELTNDLPAYLVFLILGHTKALRNVQPDHILVKAVEAALAAAPADNPDQSSLNL